MTPSVRAASPAETRSFYMQSKHRFESLEVRRLLAVTAVFVSDSGILSIQGDDQNNTIIVSRDPAGNILVNGGAVPIDGGIPTAANTTLIEVFGQAGDDTI